MFSDVFDTLSICFSTMCPRDDEDVISCGGGICGRVLFYYFNFIYNFPVIELLQRNSIMDFNI